MKAEELDIKCVESNLAISGERKIAPGEEGGSYHRREREEGNTFRRIIFVPERVNPGKISADLKNGVLTVILSKAEEVKPQKIKVTTG